MNIPVWVRDMDDAHSVFHSYCRSVDQFVATLRAAPTTVDVSAKQPMDDGRTTVVAKETAPEGGERYRQYIIGDARQS